MLKDFIDKWFTSVNTDIKNEELLEIVKSFRCFDKNTSLKDKESTWMNKDNNLRIRLWYKDKTDTEWFDSKCYFHYDPKILIEDTLNDNTEYQDFLKNINKLYWKLKLHVVNIFEQLDKTQYINKSDFIDKKWNCNLTLRILNYKPKDSCVTLAKDHTDRNFMTLAVYETEEGLRFYSRNSINNIKYIPSELKIFPWDLWSNYTNTEIYWTKHDVIKKEWNTERSSIVLFCLPLE